MGRNWLSKNNKTGIALVALMISGCLAGPFATAASAEGPKPSVAPIPGVKPVVPVTPQVSGTWHAAPSEDKTPARSKQKATPPPVALLSSWTVDLTTTKTSLKDGDYAILTATANADVSGSGYSILIYDTNADGYWSCSSGTTCTGAAFDTSYKDTDYANHYVAYIAPDTTANPPAGIQAESDVVTVLSDLISLRLSFDGSVFSSGYFSGTGYALSNRSVNFAISKVIYDLTSHQPILYCLAGSACGYDSTQGFGAFFSGFPAEGHDFIAFWTTNNTYSSISTFPSGSALVAYSNIVSFGGAAGRPEKGEEMGPGGCNGVVPNTQGCAADPVNTATGAFNEGSASLIVPGRGPGLAWTATYSSSSSGADVGLGPNWTFPYAAHLAPTPGSSLSGSQTIRAVLGNGSMLSFTSGSGGYTSNSWVQATLATTSSGYRLTERSSRFLDFDSQGRLTSISDLNGFATALGYDTNGNLASVTDSAGRTLTVSWGANREIASVTDSGSRQISYGYDPLRRLVSITDAESNETTFSYPGDSPLIATVTSPEGGVTTNTYDNYGRVTNQEDPLHHSTTFAYSGTSGSGHTTVTDPKGNVTVDYYTDSNLVQRTRGYGTSAAATTSYEFDPSTLGTTSTTDPDGHEWTATFDSAGNQLTATDPLTHTTTTTYNGFNEPLTITDPTGVVTTNTYDSSGNLLTTSTPLLDSLGATVATRTTTYAYDGTYVGDVMSLTDPDGNVTSYTYDSYGDLTSETLPATPENSAGNKTTYGYDTNTGLRTSVTSPRGNVSGGTPSHYTSHFAFNANGQLVSAQDPLWTSGSAHALTNIYDGDGNVVSSTDGEGHATTFTYDDADRLTTTTRPDSTTLGRTYYDDGTVHTQTDGGGNTTTFTYDPLGRVLAESTPMGNVTTYGYDLVGNLVSKQDPGGSCAASTPVGCTTYSYDDANQPTGTSYSDGSTPNVTYGYDANGRRTSMQDGTGTSTWEYDSLGRIMKTTAPNQNDLVYDYDLVGNNTVIDYGAGFVVNRAFDAANRLYAVTDPQSNTTTFTYDPDSNEVGIEFPTDQTTPVTDSYTFGRDGTITAANLATNSDAPATLAYTRNGKGQLTGESSTGLGEPAHTYGYNVRGQLTSDTTSAGTQTYGIDAAGNPIQTATWGTQTFNADGELCWSASSVIGGAECDDTPPSGSLVDTYDTRGNLTSAVGDDSTAGYGWDQANRMIDISWETTGYSQDVTYTYNGDGLRTSSVSSMNGNPFTDDIFAWQTNGGNPRLLYDGSNGAYIYGPDGTVIEKIYHDDFAEFQHSDQLGSVRVNTGLDNTVTRTGNYDPQGDVTAGYTAPIGYAGQYLDDFTATIYMQNRSYDPRTATFLSRDPLANITGTPYNYIDGDPLNGTDPTGLDTCFWNYCVGFHPDRAINPIVNFGRGVTGGLTDKVANWISPGASCAVGGNTLAYGLGLASVLVTPAAAVRRGGTIVEEANGSARGIPGLPSGWQGREANNGKGWVWQEPGTPGNANSMRVMDPTAQYPNGYVRFYNESGQPLSSAGKPGPNSTTHIARDSSGGWSVPAGWGGIL